jgi:hypothetical protein
LEIESNLVYVIKIDDKFHKITGQDIILSANMENKDIVVMFDNKSNIDDISQAIKIISDTNK